MVLAAARDLRVEEIPEFEPGADDVMVQSLACGVCGSDLRYYLGENPWAQHTLGRSVPNPPNIVPGHEFCGIVTEVGADVDRSWLGKRVAVMPFQVCGECAQCRAGYSSLCVNTQHLGHGGGWPQRGYYPGGMAERCPVWVSSCFELPPGLNDSEAALLDMLGVAVHAVNRARLSRGDLVAVIGAGPIGLSIAQVAIAKGAGRVLLFDPSETARKVSRTCGMSDVFEVPGDGISAALQPVRDLGGAKVVYDTVGSGETLKAGLDALRFGGQLVVMAAHDGPLPFTMLDIGQERSITTSCNFNAGDEFAEAIRLAASGRVKLAPYVTREVPLAEGPAAFEAMVADRSWAFKTVIIPQR
jgi:2-desacetyl-2-hydroxyethyl bacteriochlorophyllide A dehydrogenase